MMILITSPCYSKWVKIREEKKFSEYIEIDSVKKRNDFIYLWSMLDYKKPNISGNLSVKYYSKYNCSKMKYKIISIIEYTTSMGKGRNFTYTKNLTNETDESTELNWKQPLPDSPDYDRLVYVCNPKKK